MSKYKYVTLALVEEANAKTFRAANILSIVGLIILGCSVGLLEVGTLRTIGVIGGLIFMTSPFALRFVIDKHRKIGVIRFSDKGILTKLKDGEPISFETSTLTSFEYHIVDFEGETKTRDLALTSTTMNIRTGAENSVYWKTDQAEFQYQFKLGTELEKRKALHFLKSIEKEVIVSNII